MLKDSYVHFNNKKETSNYTRMYKDEDLKEFYPANLQRFKIIEKLIKQQKPKKIIDAGCGAGLPLIKLKKKGYNITGYDNSANMVKEAQNNLVKNNFSKDLIIKGNFENPSFIKNNSVDCIIGLGTFYYSKKFNYTLKNQIKKLKKNGRLIFSLRNELFDAATFNEYSEKFFIKLYDIKSKDNIVKKKFKVIFKEYFRSKTNMQKNIDQKKVYSSRHNPLTFEKNVCQKLNIKLNGIYYYHFHSLPPFFEKNNRLKFRKDSIKLEDPNDWRGIFLASGFVVDCSKK